jgi:soluble lytic murein transglycosylase-like protein
VDLSTIDVRRALVAKWAAQHGLAIEIVCAVCEQESSWDTNAVRFEPAFETRYIHPALPAAPTTLEMTKAMSFGLMQIMGETAIEFGFKFGVDGRFLTALCIPDVGVDFGCRKLRRCFDLHGGDPELSLLAYNGGSNTSYGREVLARVPAYQ